MTEQDRDTGAGFGDFAGRVLFPRTLTDLTTTTHCPACFSRLTSTLCGVCGLDLDHPAAARLASTSLEAATVLDRRTDLIGLLRFDGAAKKRANAEAAAAARPDAAASVASSPVHPEPVAIPEPAAGATYPEPAVIPAWSVQTPPVKPPSAPPAYRGEPSGALAETLAAAEYNAAQAARAPRRSSVQVALLVVGVSLLSIAAVFFLVYAFINYGIVWRSLIIGAITVAAFTVASRLRRRNLRGTAEGIAVFAVVLVYLDAYAIRANDLFGAATSEPLAYWGATLVISSVGFIAWHRITGLRVANFAGFLAIVPGVGLLAAGIAEAGGAGLDPIAVTFIGYAAAAAAGLTHPLAVRSRKPEADPADGTIDTLVEQVFVLVTSAAAFVIAAITAGIPSSGDTFGPGWNAASFAVLAVIAAAHVVVIHRLDTGSVHPAAGRFARVFGLGFAIAGAATAVFTVPVAVGDFVDLEVFMVIAVAWSAVVTVGLDIVARRLTATTFPRDAVRFASVTAGILAILAIAFPASVAGYSVVDVTSEALLENAWALEPTDRLIDVAAVDILSVVSLWIVVALVTLGSAIAGLLRSRVRALTWFVGAALVLSVPIISTLSLVLVAWFALGAIAIAALAAISRRRGSGVAGAPTAALVVTGAAAIAAAWSASWASTSTWYAGTIITAVLLIGARWLLGRRAPAAGAVLVGATAGVTLIGAGALGQFLHLAEPAPLLVTIIDSELYIAAAAALALVPALLWRRRTLDARVVFWFAAPAGILALTLAGAQLATQASESIALLVIPGFGLPLGISLVLVAVFVASAAQRRVEERGGFRAERIVAAALVAPALFWATDFLARLVDLPSFAAAVLPMTVAVLVAALALALTVTKLSSTPRWAWEIGAIVVGLPALFAPILIDTRAMWLALVLAGVAALLAATSADGLFGSSSARTGLGWLALIFGTAGLWWRLAVGSVTAIEAYVLPLAGALALVALLVWWSARRSSAPDGTTIADSGRGASARFLLLAALLVGIIPVALAGATGTPVRALVVGLASAVLLVGGSALRNPRLQPYLDVAAASGAAGVIVTAAGRAWALTSPAGVAYGTELDAWVIGAFLALGIAAFAQARALPGVTSAVPAPASRVTRAIIAEIIAAVAIVMLLVFEGSNLDDTTVGSLRALTLVLLLSGIYVIAAIVDERPLSSRIGWVALAASALAAVLAVGSEAIRPVEVAAVPLALALLAVGSVRLDREPQARSWVTLAPGLLVLFVPAMLASTVDRPAWRLVGIGVFAVAAIVIGVTRRLQAPFTIGVVVALVHGFATFAPQLQQAYEALPWWLWAGAGGIILIVLAARYEHRVRNLRSAAVLYSSLR